MADQTTHAAAAQESPAEYVSRTGLTRAQKKLILRVGLAGFVGLFGLLALTVISRVSTSITRSEETAAIFNVSAQLPDDLAGAVEWLPDPTDGIKALAPLEREAITDAWLRGWAQISILSDGQGPVGSSVDGKNTDGLDEYFAGSAKEALLAAAPDWLGLPVHQIGHELQLTFYSDDGSVVALESTSSRMLRSQPLRGGHEWYDADETFEAVFVLEAGAWKMHHWRRTSADGRWWSDAPARSTNSLPDVEVRALDYVSAHQTEEEFWTEFDADQAESDLAAIKELGFNAIRLGLPFERLGGRDVAATDLTPALEMADLARRNDMAIIFSLLEGRTEHQPLNWDADDDHLRTVVNTLGSQPALILWDLKHQPDLDIGKADVDQEMLWAWLGHISRTLRSVDPTTPMTIGWSTPRAAAEAPRLEDVISFDFDPAIDWPTALAEIRGTSGDRPIMLATTSFHTHTSFLPGAQNEVEQAAYYADMRQAVADNELAGFAVETFQDFDVETVAARAQLRAEQEDAAEKAELEERLRLYPPPVTPEPKERSPEEHVAPVVAEVVWPTGAGALTGLVNVDGTPKAAAAVFAPGADLDAVPRPGLVAKFTKPFFVVLGFLGAVVVGGWTLLALWDHNLIPAPNFLRRLFARRRRNKARRRENRRGRLRRLLGVDVPDAPVAYVLPASHGTSGAADTSTMSYVELDPETSGAPKLFGLLKGFWSKKSDNQPLEPVWDDQRQLWLDPLTGGPLEFDPVSGLLVPVQDEMPAQNEMHDPQVAAMHPAHHQTQNHAMEPAVQPAVPAHAGAHAQPAPQHTPMTPAAMMPMQQQPTPDQMYPAHAHGTPVDAVAAQHAPSQPMPMQQMPVGALPPMPSPEAMASAAQLHAAQGLPPGMPHMGAVPGSIPIEALPPAGMVPPQAVPPQAVPAEMPVQQMAPQHAMPAQAQAAAPPQAVPTQPVPTQPVPTQGTPQTLPMPVPAALHTAAPLAAPMQTAPMQAAPMQTAPMQTVPPQTVPAAMPIDQAMPVEVNPVDPAAGFEPAVVQQTMTHPPAPAFVGPAVGEVVTISVDLENVERAILATPDLNVAAAGATRYLPFVVRAVAIAARQHPLVATDTVLETLDISIRSTTDDTGAHHLITAASNRRLAGLADEICAVLDTPGSPQAASVCVSAVDRDGVGLAFGSAVAPFRTLITITGAEPSPVATSDQFGCSAVSVHTIAVIGMACSDQVLADARDAFLNELKDQLETRNWITELD